MFEQQAPMVFSGNKIDATMDDYFADAEWIWRRDARERSVFDLWLHVITHTTKLVEAVRKERPKEVIDDLADTTMWLYSFIAQLHRSNSPFDKIFKIDTLPSDLIWNKYPGMCPACFDFSITRMLGATKASEAPIRLLERKYSINEHLQELAKRDHITTLCGCLSRINFAEERHIIFDNISFEIDKLRIQYADLTRQQHKAKTLSQFELMFESIFINSYYVFSIQTVAFHLLEEVGEVTMALKDCYTYDLDREPFSPDIMNKRRLKLEEEIADVFSWIFALMLKIRHVYYQDAQEYFQTLLPANGTVRVQFDFIKKISLSEIIWAKYGKLKNGQPNNNLLCTGCFTAPCTCRRDLKIAWSKRKEKKLKKPT